MAEYTLEQRQWRSRQDAEDRERQDFYGKVNQFPNLFSKRQYFQNRERIKELLRKQQAELDSALFEYHLETVRCQNLIVFLLYLLGKKREAFEYCKQLMSDQQKSFIRLTSFAILQWELGHRSESEETLLLLWGLTEEHDYEYLMTVAKSDIGHALLCYGHACFSQVLNLYDEVLKECPNSNVFLWKYDLALAIRRNFNIFIYSEHESASLLAKKAATLFSDVSKNCPNHIYRARAQIELASLVSHLQSFMGCCRKEDKEVIAEICAQDRLSLANQAIKTLQNGQDDYYVKRVSGRLYGYAGDYDTALKYLLQAYSLRDDDIVNQLIAKTYLSYSRKKKRASVSHDSIQAARGGIDHDKTTTTHLWSFPPDSTAAVCDEARRAEEKNGQVSGASGAAQFTDNYSLHKTRAPYRGKGVSEPLHLPDEDYQRWPKVSLHQNTELCKSGLYGQTAQEYQLKAAEFDASVSKYMDADGTFKSTQHNCVGNIPKPGYATKYREEMAAGLALAYDEAILVNEDETFKSQETVFTNTPPFKVSASSTPSLQPRRRNLGRHTTASSRAMRCLLKLSSFFSSYDESDPYIQKAKEHFRRALKINPNNKSILYDLGCLYKGLDKPKEALEYFEQIIYGSWYLFPLELVNAYEQGGLCLLRLSELPETGAEEKKHLVSRAENMFMNSLRECRRAVANLPGIGTSRDILWSSYSQLLAILQNPMGEVGGLHKVAEVHELVDRYLEALKVYQDVLKLAHTTQDRKRAILGLVRNNVNMKNINDARFILDILLSSDVRQDILGDTDDTMCELHSLAASVYNTAAASALNDGLVRDARLCFQSALLLGGWIRDISDDDDTHGINGVSSGQRGGVFDVCIFDDEVNVAEDSPEHADNTAARVSSSLVKVMQALFGMRVNLNDNGVEANRLIFTGEMKLAEAAAVVVLVVPPGESLSPRMNYLADVALQSRSVRCVLPVVVGDPDGNVPPPLRNLPNFSNGMDLLRLCDDDDINVGALRENSDVVMRLFQSVFRDTGKERN